MRTIIDILRRGNLELFHSAMLAWLLDHSAEHGLGREFLDRFAARVSQLGFPSLQKALEARLPETIATELPGREGRTDIELLFADGARVVVENKTKSIGTLEQLERYDSSGAIVIALGYVEACFPRAAKRKFPVLTYGDILSILSGLKPAEGAWGFLLTEYRRFLERDMDVLTRIAQRAQASTSQEWKPVLLKPEYSTLYRTNDRRLFQYFFLVGFGQYLADHAFVSTSEEEWEVNKDQISGVWLSGPKTTVQYSPTLRRIASKSASFWLHVELHDGLFGDKTDRPAGEIQLRASVDEGDLSSIREEFRAAFPLAQYEHYPQRRQGDTGKVIFRTLRENELGYPMLMSRLAGFAERFFVLG